MLGLHTKNGWRAGLAIAVTGTLIGLGAGPAFAADPQAQANSSALTATGSLVGDSGLDLNSGECRAELPGGNPEGAGVCGNGLNTIENIDAFGQNAQAGTDGQNCVDFGASSSIDMYGTENPTPQYVHPGIGDTSCATASVSPFNLTSLANISTTDIITNGLAGLQTDTILDQIGGPLGDLLTTLLENNTGLLTQIDGVLKQITVPVQDALPVSLQIGATDAACAATTASARGNSRVASVTLHVGSGETAINVPFNGPNDLDTPPNTKLLSGSLDDLADAIFGGLHDTLQTSLGGALSGVNLLTDPIRAAIVQQVLPALQANLLSALEDGLAPLVKGTVNKQTDGDGHDVSYTSSSTREIEVTGLDVILFQGAESVPGITPGAGGATQTLQLGRVDCGPNGPGNNGGTPGLQFDKDATTDHGDAKFTLTVKNSTNSAIDDVFVQDFYGDDIDAKDVKSIKVSQGTFNKETGRWTVGTLGAGKTAKLTFKVDVSKSDLDDGVKNAACVNKASKPGHIQKNDGVADDTDGCDEDTAKKNDDSDSDSDSNSDSDSDNNPRSVDSGLNDGGNLGTLAITGLLAASTLVGSAARQRLLLDR